MDKYMYTALRAMLLLATALGLTACATYPKSFSNESPIADFSDYKSYNFAAVLGTDYDKEVRSLLTQYLVSEIGEQMANRGYVYQEDNADVSFNFDLITQEKIRSRPSGGIGYGGFGPGYGGFYGGYGGFYGNGFGPGFGYGGFGGGFDNRIVQYTEGSLYVSIIDNATRGVVWEGVSVSRINDEVLGNLGLSIKNAITGMFEQFPYFAAGSARAAWLKQPATSTTG